MPLPLVDEDRIVANAGGDQAIEFCEHKLWLGPRPAILSGHASALEPTPGRTSRQYPCERRSPATSVRSGILASSRRAPRFGSRTPSGSRRKAFAGLTARLCSLS